MMGALNRYVFASGNGQYPLIVGSHDRPIAEAVKEARRQGGSQLVTRIDLQHAENAPEAIGRATPDGQYLDLAGETP